MVPNFLTYSNLPARAHTRTQKHNHTHTCATLYCLRGNIFAVSYQFLLLPYEAPVSSSCKFPHKAITVVLLQQHDMLCGSVCGIYCGSILCYIFTPLHYCIPLMYLSPCSPDPSPHTPVESRSVQWSRTAGHSTATASHKSNPSSVPRGIVHSYSTLPWVMWQSVTVVEGVP